MWIAGTVRKKGGSDSEESVVQTSGTVGRFVKRTRAMSNHCRKIPGKD
jgi:hypothetical protein